MNAITSTSSSLVVPVPASPIAVRVATMADLPFLDALQKQHSKQLGFFPRAQMEGYIEMGGVLIAQHSPVREDGVVSENAHLSSAQNPALPGGAIGYVISRDRYLKRDELGVVYQLCVVPGDQRKLVGASLIKAVFERSAYGCKLYCCWCAQDLAANSFWESLGFVPIAFRAGSTGKKRVHIFWQRRIAEGDATPWWYPFQTNAGAIREDRIVFPIPPGVHWSEVRAVAAPTAGEPARELVDPGSVREARPALTPALPGTTRPRRAPVAVPAKPAGLRMMGGLYAAPVPAPTGASPRAARAKASAAKEGRQPSRRTGPERSRRIDPMFLAQARELRDRWMERLNGAALLATNGKYDVARSLPPARGAGQVEPLAARPAAALLPAA